MKTVTQTMLYRQAIIQYAEKYGVTKAAIRYKTNRQYIYRWRKRYDADEAKLYFLYAFILFLALSSLEC